MEEKKKTMRARDILLYLAVSKGFDWDAIYCAIKNKEMDFTPEDVRKVAERYPNAITMLDDDYPVEYKSNYYHPPFVIIPAKRKG